jgi:hypothetical protein
MLSILAIIGIMVLVWVFMEISVGGKKPVRKEDYYSDKG